MTWRRRFCGLAGLAPDDEMRGRSVSTAVTPSSVSLNARALTEDFD